MIRYGQMQNPDTKHWVKVDRDSGAVMGESKRQFAGIPVIVKDSQHYRPPRMRRSQSEVSDPLGAVRR